MGERTQSYIKKYMAEFSNLSLKKELEELDERAKTCPIAECYSIIVRYLNGEYGIVQNYEKLTEISKNEGFRNKVKNCPKRVRKNFIIFFKVSAIVINTLRDFGVDFKILSELYGIADVELGVLEP